MKNARRALALAAAWVLGIGPGWLTASGWSKGPCAQATSSANLAAPNEPGERLVVAGTVFAPDGVTPAPGVFLYAYNADATGHYSQESGAPPRLRGWMKTGADGRYEYRTIKPAPYPDRTIPAHVHLQLWGGGYPAQGGNELLFAGDPLVSAADREKSSKLGRFAFVLPASKDGQGVWHVAQDLRLKTTGDHFSANSLHGQEPCGGGQ